VDEDSISEPRAAISARALGIKHMARRCAGVCVAPDVAPRNLYAGRSRDPRNPFPQRQPSNIVDLFLALSFYPVPSHVSFLSLSQPRGLLFARRDIGIAYRISIAATITASLCATGRWCRHWQRCRWNRRLIKNCLDLKNRVFSNRKTLTVCCIIIYEGY